MHNVLRVTCINAVANMARVYELRGVKKEYHEKFKTLPLSKRTGLLIVPEVVTESVTHREIVAKYVVEGVPISPH